jgi:catechol 2,3-dioxygenase-like lactoylglutathione lyase family enzyme
MTSSHAPELDGVHHLKLPVGDLNRSRAWYESRLGYQVAIETLARRLTALGEQHAGVHFATMGWILPHTHDPDGHEIRFYTTEHHTDPRDEEIRQVNDAVATAAACEQAYLAAHHEAGHGACQETPGHARRES